MIELRSCTSQRQPSASVYNPPLSFELATLVVQLLAVAAQIHLLLPLKQRAAASNNSRAAAVAWIALPVSLVLAGSSELLDWDPLLLGPSRAPVPLRLTGWRPAQSTTHLDLVFPIPHAAGWFRTLRAPPSRRRL